MSRWADPTSVIGPAFREAPSGEASSPLRSKGAVPPCGADSWQGSVTERHGFRYSNWMQSIPGRRRFDMERIHIIVAIVLVLSALKKFEDILAQYRESAEAGRSNMEDCSCNSGTTRRQAPLSPSEQRPGSALRSRFMAEGL
jgi:hypothetical protein